MLTSEYGMLKRLHEDHIIKVFDLIVDDASDESHMTMEYFSATSIHDYIALNGTFNEEEARVITKQVLDAINSLHKNGITHCDIKPENILINEDKEVKLIDFNISKSKCDCELSPDTADTKFGSFSSLQLSSPLYAAPEMKNRKYSQSVDIWGTGIVLFTILLGTMKSHKLNKIKDLDERSKTMKKIIADSTVIKENTKEFLYKLLSDESEERPTAREALVDDWFMC
jgi:serine/threonine protein kinase